jgi:hypothetical protein
MHTHLDSQINHNHNIFVSAMQLPGVMSLSCVGAGALSLAAATSTSEDIDVTNCCLTYEFKVASLGARYPYRVKKGLISQNREYQHVNTSGTEQTQA